MCPPVIAYIGRAVWFYRRKKNDISRNGNMLCEMSFFICPAGIRFNAI